MNDNDLRQLRREYNMSTLSRSDLAVDPFQQFADWLQQARELPIEDVTAMTVATASASGQPAVRTVLLKHYDADGFCWYTDQSSPQGVELKENPLAELLFFWQDLSRQVRIAGTVETLDEAMSDAYFNARPQGSRFAAAASLQSSVLNSRSELEERLTELEQRFPNGDVPRPARWGGYRLRPRQFEFWQGRESRLHDRFRFSATGDSWQIERLSP